MEMLNIQSISAMNSINALNTQTAYNMDGKIFVSTDMFTPEKTQKMTVSDILNRLNGIDNLSRDKNSSQSLPFTGANTSAKKREQAPQEVKTQEGLGRLLNVYA